MKRIFTLFLLAIVGHLVAQTTSVKKEISSLPQHRAGVNFINAYEKPKAFIENGGQLDFIKEIKQRVLFEFHDDLGMQVYFTPDGLIYKITSEKKVSREEWERYARKNKLAAEEDEDGAHYIASSAFVYMQWEGANADARATGLDAYSHYYNYFMPEIDPHKVIGNVKGYHKLVYTDVYPNIDVEYTIHPKEGVKYSFILHPGADPSKIKMTYSGADIKKENGNIILSTNAGSVTDHAPLTYKGNETNQNILESEFVLLDKNSVGFKLAGNSNTITETTVIDPWTVTTYTFGGSNHLPYDLSVDGSDNIYVYSCKLTNSTSNQSVEKFNSSGTLQWTFNLTTNTNGYGTDRQGDIVVDQSGNSYVTCGLGGYYNTLKLNPAGNSILWSSSATQTSTNGMYETWTINFNCDYTKLYQSGGGLKIGLTAYYNVGVFEPLNTSTGAEGTLTENDTIGEIISSVFAPNGYYYVLAADSNIGAIRTGLATSGAKNTLSCYNTTTGARVWRKSTGYPYIDGDQKQPGGSGASTGGSIGYNAIAASCNYVFTTSGAVLDKWDLLTGSHLGQVTITGGSATPGAVNSGIVTDKCGNVYVGANTNIYVYDANLTLLNTISGLPGLVIDLAWGSNSQLFACGGISSSTSFLSSVTVPTCTASNSGISISATQPSGCGGTGSATVTATFCGAPYTYSWSPSGGTGATASGLPAGVYTVTVTGSAQCPYTYSSVGTVTINAGSGGLSATQAQSNILCNGICTGAATITPTGGTSPYTYTWSPSGGNSSSASSLCAGTYTVTIHDNAGCAATQTVSITQPASALSAVASSTSTCSGSCNGTTTVVPSGGTPSYSYTWSPSGGNGTSATSLCAGTYSVTVKDNNGCATTQTVSVVGNPTPILSVNSAVICSGTSTTLTASGATTYSWSPASGLSSTTGSVVTATPTVSTTYTITGTTGTCTSNTTSTVTINPTPTVSVNSATMCSGSSATLTATGATSYSWSPSGGLSATTGSVVAANPTSTTIYTVSGTSAGCSGINTSTVTINPTPTISVNAATICPGATATLSASGASSYTWSPATGLSSTSGATVTANPAVTTTYTLQGAIGTCTNVTTTTVTVSGSLNVSVNSPSLCSGSSTTLNASGAASYSWSPAGGLSSTSGPSVTANPTVTTTYTVVGTSGSCSSTATSTVTVNPTPSVSVSASPAVICSGSSTTLSGSGASSYTWSTGATGPSTSVSPTSNTTYTLYGSTGSCKDSSTISVTVNPLPSLTVTATPTTICSGQSATITGSGATSYTWSANAGGVTTPSATITPNATDTYTLTGNIAGCTSTKTVTVNVMPTPTLSVNSTPSTICAGKSSVISVSGATTYTWSANAGSVSTSTVSVSPSSSTVYTVTGQSSGCTSTGTVGVNVTPLPSLTITATPASICLGQSSVLSGSGANTFTWSANAGGANTSTVSVSPATTTSYTLSGTQSGCSDSTVITITVGSPPVLNVNATQTTICSGQSTTITGSGATNYTWTPGPLNGASITPTLTATTTFTLVGNSGACSNSTTITINVNPTPTVTANAASPAICFGQSVVLTAGGATTYTWGSNAGGVTTNTTSVSPPISTIYTVTGTNANGCIASSTVNVTVNPLPNVNTGPNVSVCAGGSVTLSGSGAVTYTWTGGVTNGVSFTPASSGTYTVTGTDNNGCQNSATVSVTVNALPNVSGGTNQSTCIGNSVTLSGSGASTYTWTGGVMNGIPFTPSVTTTYTLTGTNANGCVATSTVNVTVDPLPQVNAGGMVVIPCGATTFTLNGSTNATSPTYSWTGPGIVSGGNTATPVVNSGGTYTLTVTDGNGCKDTATSKVLTTTISVSFTPDITSGFSPLHVVFTNNSMNATTYTWTLGNGTTSNSFNTNGTYTTSGTYTVILTGTNGGCIDTAVRIIKVLENSSIVVPNIFSPNGDGLNDIFTIQTTGMEELQADIYNRWGEVVGKINGVNDSWNGHTMKGVLASDGTYYYVLTAKGYDGKTYDRHGFLTLLR